MVLFAVGEVTKLKTGILFLFFNQRSDRRGLSISCHSDSQSFSKFTVNQSKNSLLVHSFLALQSKLQEVVLLNCKVLRSGYEENSMRGFNTTEPIRDMDSDSVNSFQ